LPTAFDVSVVIQGPIVSGDNLRPATNCTQAVIDSVRRWLPSAEIILSTWAGAECAHLDVDALVLSRDPGGVPLNDSTLQGQTNNLNRMVVSTAAGLARCERPYAIKLRTDTPLVAPPPFDSVQPISCNGVKPLFERRVVVSNVYTRNPLERPVLFHLSDLVHFGLTGDLRQLWGAPLVDEPAFTRWLENRPNPRCNAYPGNRYLFRCAPEQYLVESLVRRRFPKTFLSHPGDGNTRLLFLWLWLLATHFVVVPQLEFFALLPARMQQAAGQSDLWQEDQLPWLSLWARDTVPMLTRVQAIIGYCESRYRYLDGVRGKAFMRKLRRAFVR